MEFRDLAANLGIDEEDFLELAELFVSTTQEDIIKIEKSLLSNDTGGAAAAAHSIKGAAGNMGFMSLSDIAKTMESEAKSGNLGNFSQLLARLNQELDPIEKKIGH